MGQQEHTICLSRGSRWSRKHPPHICHSKRRSKTFYTTSGFPSDFPCFLQVQKAGTEGLGQSHLPSGLSERVLLPDVSPRLVWDSYLYCRPLGRRRGSDGVHGPSRFPRSSSVLPQRVHPQRVDHQGSRKTLQKSDSAMLKLCRTLGYAWKGGSCV